MSPVRRYCEMCDKWLPANQRECRDCGALTVRVANWCAACYREGATAGGDTTSLEHHTCVGDGGPTR